MKLPPLKKKRKEYFLALDIGTEAVKALVFEKNGKYSILSGSLQYFNRSRPFDNDKVIFNVKEEAVSLAGKIPTGLLVGFSPNILRSRVRSISISRQKPENLISNKEAESITESVLKEAKKGISKNFSEYSGILPQEIKFVDSVILEVKIDGYEVPILPGYSGKNLEFKVLASFLPKGYLENFDKVFKGFNLKSQKIINPIKNLINFPEVADGIFIDIGGEVTQICLIRNRKICMIDEFDMGGSDFSNVFSEILGMHSKDARLLKERYARGDLTYEVRQRVKEMLEPSLKEWKLKLESKLKSITGLLPSIFFIFGGASQFPGIEELLAENEKDAKLIYPQDFKDIIDKTNCINTAQFVNPILLCYAS